MSIKEAEKLSTAELRKRAIRDGGIAMLRLRERSGEMKLAGYQRGYTHGGRHFMPVTADFLIPI